MPSSADGLFAVELFEPVGPETDEHRRQLPGRVAPLPGEALGSWLLRYAEPFGLAPEALLLRSCDVELAAATEWWRRPHRALIDGLAQRTGVSAAEIGVMTFADWLGDGRSDEMPERFSRLRFQNVRPVTRQMRRTSVCPRCIAEDETQYIRRNWTLGWITACPAHGTVLVSECPDCGTKLRLPRLSSGDYFAPGRCARCAFRLGRADDRRAHQSVLDLQARMLDGRDRGVFDLPGHGIIPWPVAVALFDVLLGAVWIETKPSARTRLFARIAKDIGRDELGENPTGSYEGLAILAWILAGWPDRLRIAIAILRARRPRRQLERWQDLDDEMRCGVEALLLAAWPDETADPDRAWWRSWIESLPETGDDLRARAGRERFPHRRARLLALADVRDGMPVELAADAAGVTPRTLYTWLKRGAAGGIEAALDRPSGVLSQAQRVEIAHWIAEAPASGPRWRANRVKNEVFRRYGLEIGLHVAGHLLHDYGPWRRRRPTIARRRNVDPPVAD
jgi:transposase